MITNEQYLEAVTDLVLKGTRPNDNQCSCICQHLTPDLMIVAGPGTGKTTVLVLRALKHVIVDQVPPEEIVVTTFTRKAAAELRGRLIDWGIMLIDHFKTVAKARGTAALQRHLALADVSAFVTGTLDGLCEQWLGRMRRQGEVPPVMIEGFAARQIYARQIFGDLYRDPKYYGKLNDYLGCYGYEQKPPTTQGEAVEIAKGLIDRLVQDLVDLDQYANAKGDHKDVRALLAQSLTDLHNLMRSEGQYDFALLEQEFLNKLSDAELVKRLGKTRVLLIDEYQDTNPLQEAIYFSLAKMNQCSVTVVGDDDQSLYRFRGATVELFRDFRARISLQLGRPQPTHAFLVHNYRSTENIVDFFNSFIENDPHFAGARVQPPKPRIQITRTGQSVPLLGMFRDNEDDLARDLASFIDNVFRKGGVAVRGTTLRLKGSDHGGNIGDAVYMGHSVAEFGRPGFGKPAKAKLTWKLREELRQRGISVFNPRGRALKDIDEVRVILGLISLCLDPAEELLQRILIRNHSRDAIHGWRTTANQFIALNPAPNRPRALADFVRAWQQSKPSTSAMKWPDEWPVLDLLYKLLTWFPAFQNDPEYQVYLEAITRSITQATSFSPYQGRILNKAPHQERSRESIYRDILAPIAENVVDVDEELLTHVPRDHLNVMTIHQSKGLEFPLVIVDVGSAFSTNHKKQRFKRFPDDPSNVALLESDLSPYTKVGHLRLVRGNLDRTFEDLIRLYYVAYSRPQTALLLVGHNKLLQGNTAIKNIATFWRQDGSWAWQRAGGPRPPATVAGHPLTEI